MSRPKLVYKKATKQWYRNGVLIKDPSKYRFYNTTIGQWCKLTEDGRYEPMNYEKKSKEAADKMTNSERAYSYGHRDLAPMLFLHGTQDEDDRIKQRRMEFYNLVQDSIAKRAVSGYYDQYPEMFNRDRQMANQYLVPGAINYPTCINSVSGLSGTPVSGNYTFREKTPSRYGSRERLQPRSGEDVQNISIGSVIQIDPAVLSHSVSYMGNYDPETEEFDIYNSHGHTSPYIDGDQIERVSADDYQYGQRNAHILSLYPLKKHGGRLIPRPPKKFNI